MNLEHEFRCYLQKIWVSEKTGRSMSPKATSDAVSRCKLVEKTLSLELSPATVKGEDAYQDLLSQIRVRRISSNRNRPYAHSQIIYSVKLYREFVLWWALSSLPDSCAIAP